MFKRSLFGTLQAYFAFYRALARDPRTPGISKALPWIALLYVLSPIDFIPDFLPIIGLLDDLTIAPLLILLAFWLIPRMIKQEHRRNYIEGTLSQN